MRRMIKILSGTILAAAFILLFPGVLPEAQAAYSTSAAGIVTVSSGSLNVRASASSSGTRLTSLSKGTYVTLISKSGSWWKVEYASGSYGYVSAGYITVTESSASAVTAGSLNVRTGAGTSYSVKGTLSYGKTVLVLSASGNWSKILYNGSQVGYVSSTYLKTLMTWPVPVSGSINQSFVSGSHLGIDIAPASQGMAGDSVIAAYSGTVVYSGYLNGYGYVVYVNSYCNGKYIQTRYAHLKSASSLSYGDTVATSQYIGAMGSTGTSSGVHLHFEVRIRASSGDCISNSESTAVNPLGYVTYGA
ncbi:SH3 domain-containing protein [Papillibacter cinnamivorans]|uniref:SH3 domain-containing protein n=1 Tax=Papillibacter cinnamivorans DSM 12816 TaxID=1122930 RepID=A0A1W2BGG5_9FIRM|nr:SH3 domain-containing protein [Papillibacter cinnamivorans]SMC71926.1 SH3 domain-containing protein [Papillibacter cinnamivorans DSM 12816]